MNTRVLLGYVSGLGFLEPDLPLGSLVATMLLVHALDAIMCRLCAHNNGHPKNLWTALGFAFGVWAMALLMLMPKRRAPA